MPVIQPIADYHDICGEGPLWDSREQSLYWTDLARRRFYCYRWAERRAELVSEQLQVSGYAFNEAGGFVVTNIEGIWLWDAVSEPALLAREADGQRCLMNDCVADPEGRVFSGSYYRNRQSGEFERVGCLFRVDTDGSVHVVDEGFCLSNGLGFSPDCSTMYYVDSADRRIYAWDYRRSDGSIRNRRVLVQVPLDEGIPDGMTVDSEGHIWCAQWFGGCVVRYDPDGKLERRIETPASQTSSVTFGGPDYTDMFVTSAAELDSIILAPTGYDPSKHFMGGPVYHLEPGAQGREEYRAKVSISASRKASRNA